MMYPLYWCNLTKETQDEILKIAKKNGCSDMYPGYFDHFTPLVELFVGDGDDEGGDDLDTEERVYDQPDGTELIRSAKHILTVPIEEGD